MSERIKGLSKNSFNFLRMPLPIMLIMVVGLMISKISVAAERIIKIDGSSTVYPVTEAVVEEFQKAKKGTIRVTIGISGTGGGFKKFCRGETDISNASRPILKTEMEACKKNGIQFIELPVAYDGLGVMVNPKNTWVNSLTVEQLRRIWEPAAQGKITRWNQVNPEWPDAPLKLFGPGVDSGTFDYFTEAVVGKAKASRGDYTSSEDDNVLVQGIAGDKYSLGYFGLAYYEENQDKLKLVPIVNPRTGKAVLPSEKTVMDGTYQPLSRPIFIYVSTQSLERAEVKEFVEFYLQNAAKFVREVRYIPLPQKAYELAMERLLKKKTGSMFGGEPEVGVKIEDLIKRESGSK